MDAIPIHGLEILLRVSLFRPLMIAPTSNYFFGSFIVFDIGLSVSEGIIRQLEIGWLRSAYIVFEEEDVSTLVEDIFRHGLFCKF